MNYDPKEEWRQLLLIAEAKCVYEDVSNGSDIKDLLIERKCETYEDLKAIIGVIKHAKDLKDIEDKGGKAAKAIKSLVGLLPGGAAFFNWAEIPGKAFKKGKSIYDTVNNAMDKLEGLEDDSEILKKSGGALDAFKIDDGYQMITDEKLENKFFEDFSKHLENKTGPLPDKDINEFFEDWLSQNVGTAEETVTGAESDTKFTEIPAIEEPSEFKKSVDRIGGALKGSLGKFLGIS